MKVTGARVYLVNVGSLHPVLVEVLTDEGISGVGNAAVAYGIGGTGRRHERKRIDWIRLQARERIGKTKISILDCCVRRQRASAQSMYGR